MQVAHCIPFNRVMATQQKVRPANAGRTFLKYQVHTERLYLTDPLFKTVYLCYIL